MSLDVGSSSSRIPAARSRFPVRRRITTYFTGGVDGLLTVSATLQQAGCQVQDLSVDMHDGVAESSMVCTVMIADGGIDQLLGSLRGLPTVVSSEQL